MTQIIEKSGRLYGYGRIEHTDDVWDLRWNNAKVDARLHRQTAEKCIAAQKKAEKQRTAQRTKHRRRMAWLRFWLVEIAVSLIVLCMGWFAMAAYGARMPWYTVFIPSVVAMFVLQLGGWAALRELSDE